MRVMVEFNPTKGVVKVMSPASTEGESLIQPVAIPTVQGAALDAGAYAGIALGERPSAARPQSATASSATATESTPTPTIVDRF